MGKFHICQNGKSMFRADTIKVALNLWKFAIGWYHGEVYITDENGNILYFTRC